MDELPPEPPEEIIEVEEDDSEELAAMALRMDALENENRLKDEKILALEAEVARAHARCQALEESRGEGDNTPESVHFWGRKMFS